MKTTFWHGEIWSRLGRGLAGALVVSALHGISLPSAEPPAAAAAAPGPGLPKSGWAPEDLFHEISRIDDRILGVKGPHGLAQMHQGWLLLVVGGQGFGFLDLSQPRSPKLGHFQQNEFVAEGRAYGFSHGPDGDTLALAAIDGVMLWNITSKPTLLSHFKFPGADSVPRQGHAIAANWWTFYQAPYIYCGGTGRGLFVIDATDPRRPALARHLPMTQTGGFRVGGTFAVGNLLVLSGNDAPGLATLDISDPKEPRLLQALTRNLPAETSGMLNGNRFYEASSRGTVYDISDLGQIRFLAKAGPSSYPYEGDGFATVQDGFLHVGASTHYVKIGARDPSARPRVVGWDNLDDKNRDLDFASVLGPLVLIGDANGLGTFVVPHQVEADGRGPEVNMVVPRDGASGQALTTRVGLTFTDSIDLRSVTPSTLVIRPVGGDPIPGRFSHQTGIVNFSPDKPLEAQTTYEIVVPAGGIRDAAGNATEKSFASRFTTGPRPDSFALVLEATPPRPVAQPVTFKASASSQTGSLKFSWDFDDGTPPTAFSAHSELLHTFARPGHYAVKVNVTDAEVRATRAFTQTIYVPPTIQRPTASSTIILDEPRARVWAVNPDADTVAAVDTTALTKVFEAPVGRHPRTLALAPDTTLWVVNQDDATISVLDGDDGGTLQTISLPRASRPYGLAFSRDGAAAYVTLQATGKLLKLDPADGEILGTIEVGPNPRGLAITGDSERIFVTRFISSQDHGRVIEVSAAHFSSVRKHRLGLDLGPDTESSGRGVPNYLSSITITPDGRRAWVPSKKDNTGRGLFRDGRPLTFDHTVRTIVSQIDIDSNDEVARARIDLSERDLADAVCFSEHGDLAFVAIQGNNCVAVLDAYSGQLIQEIDSGGGAPQGLVLSADGRRLFIQNFLGRSVAAYDVSGLVLATDYLVQPLGVIPTVSREPLSARVLRGKQIFYNAGDPRMSRRGYLSCASCHLDGEHDGRIWDFTDRGEGLRNTVTLLGRRGTGHGKLHWTGNFDEIQDFEQDIRQSFGGLGFLPDAEYHKGTRASPLGDHKAGLSSELDELAAYVSSLDHVNPSPFRNANGTLTTSAREGRQLFRQLNCAACHSGNEFTDSASGDDHDIDTIRPHTGKRLGQTIAGLDTPTLKGLWETPPYLHDGSAVTLLDVITAANLNDMHGRTSGLSDRQRQQLVDYLLQIDEAEVVMTTGTNAPPALRP